MIDTKLATAITQYSLSWKSPNNPYVPFVTGDFIVDNFLHHMNETHGLQVELQAGFRFIRQVEIVDEAKASWFILKYT